MEAMRALLVRAKLYVEGSGAAATAALLAGKVRLPAGARRREHRLGRQRRSRARSAALFAARRRRPAHEGAVRQRGGRARAAADGRRASTLMRDALATLARGDAVLPLRTHGAAARRLRAAGPDARLPRRAAELRPQGGERDARQPRHARYDSHQGVVMLFGVEHGEPLAILDATRDHRDPHRRGLRAPRPTRWRATTPATSRSSAPARRRARTSRRCAPCGGCGACGCGAARAPTPSASRARVGAPRGVRDRGRGDRPRTRCAGADLVCTTTSAKEPVLRGAWLVAGRARQRGRRLLRRAAASSTPRRCGASRLFIDCRESCLNEAGDFLIARGEGAIADAHLARRARRGAARAASPGGASRRRDHALRVARHRDRGPGRRRTTSTARARETGAGTLARAGAGRAR